MIDHPPIIFVHGMYLNDASWAPWITRAEARGYEASAVAWPFHAGEPADLRRRIDPQLGRLTFGAVVDAVRRSVVKSTVPPILIGHSVGGLVVQRLVNEGLASAGIAICPAPPKGVFSLDPHFFRANLPHINPLRGNEPVFMTPKRFQYTFCNTMTIAESDAAFERYVVPESRNVPRSTLGRAGRIDFARGHAPLLFIAAGRDHLTPRSLIEANVRAYRGSEGSLEYLAFPDRSHFICNQADWEAVADASFNWADALAAR